MPCCACKSAGACVRCTCTLSGKRCTDCYPGRVKRCSNQTTSQTKAPLTNVLSLSQPNFSHGQADVVPTAVASSYSQDSARATTRSNSQRGASYSSRVNKFSGNQSGNDNDACRIVEETPCLASTRNESARRPPTQTVKAVDSSVVTAPTASASRTRVNDAVLTTEIDNPAEGEPKLEDSARSEPGLEDLVRVTEENDSTEKAATASHANVRQSINDTVVDMSVDSTSDKEQSTFRNMQSLPDMIIAEHSTHSPFEDGRQVDSVDNLPPFSRVSSKSFTWGDHSGEEVAVLLQDIYDEIVHWRPNIFDIPLGASGKKFVDETTRLLTAVAEASALETVGLLAIMVMPALLLQQPAPSSIHSQRVACLERRLSLWLEGKFDDLLLEGRVLQTQLKRHIDRRSINRNDIVSSDAINARRYGQLLSRGKVKSAMRLVSDKGRGRILTLDETVSSKSGMQNVTVRDVLKAKHPPAAPVDSEALLTDTPPPIHPVIFDQLDGESTRLAALHSQGSAGPSGLDSANWRRLCTMYRGQSRRLCTAMSMLAKRLCTSYIDPAVLQPFVACRLIPLSKNPGVRPIGTCETLRRILGKAIMQVVGPQIQSVVGVSQLCVRQKSGCEAAVHAMRGLFIDEKTEGLLLVDASNAFNSLNRQVMLQNIQILCPSFAPCVINHYCGSVKLFVGGETVLSLEGTTQGDPLSMAIYALGTLPLIRRADTANCIQSWFADDAGAGGRLHELFIWRKTLEEKGPMYGYHVNPSKT